MYLFQRMRTLRGGVRKPMGWAIDLTKLVNDITGADVGLWTSNFGFPSGTVVWSVRVDSRAALGEVMAKLLADDAYHAAVEKGQEWLGESGQDTLRQLVHAESLTPTPPPVGASATFTTATPAGGQLANALAWGVEVSGIYARAVGTSVSFFADAYGPFGQVTWIASHDDLEAVDAANAALQATPEYLASIDGAGSLFVPGSGMQALATRIA